MHTSDRVDDEARERHQQQADHADPKDRGHTSFEQMPIAGLASAFRLAAQLFFGAKARSNGRAIEKKGDQDDGEKQELNDHGRDRGL